MSTININRNRVLVWSLVAAMGLACSQIATTQGNGSKTKPKPAAKPVVTQYYNGIPISEKPDKVVRDVYTAMDGSTVRIIGIASITEKKIVGWDCAGKPSKDVVDLFTKTLTRPRGSYAATLPFEFGKKNRYIFIEQLNKSGLSLPIVTPQSPTHIGPFFSGDANKNVDVVLLRSNTYATEGFIEILDNTYPSKNFNFAWPIAQGDVDQTKAFEIVEIKKFKTKADLETESKTSNEIRLLKSLYFSKSLDHGSQYITVAAKGEPLQTGYSLFLLGSNGDELNMVDSKGTLFNPVHKEIWANDNPYVKEIEPLPTYSRGVQFGRNRILASILIPTLKTENVKTLQLRLATKFQVRFDHLPLDPK